MPNSPALLLNAQWKLLYQYTVDTATLALSIDTSVLSGAEESLFQGYIYAWLCHLPAFPELTLLENRLDIDQCRLLFSAETGKRLCESFNVFFSELLRSSLPEPPPEIPLTPALKRERSFLSGILSNTPYAERLEPPLFRGMANLSIEQLLSKLPLKLELSVPDYLSEMLLLLKPVWSQAWVYREPLSVDFSFLDGPVEQDCDLPLPGVWFDIGFRVPGYQLLSESYLRLLMALCEQIWESWNDHSALTLLSTEVKQWRHMGYVRLCFQGERPQDIELYRQHLWAALVHIKDQGINLQNFEHLSQRLFSGLNLNYSLWVDVSTKCLSVDALCWHQSFRESLVSYSPDKLRQSYASLGYLKAVHTDDFYATRLRSEIIEHPGRKLCYSPHHDVAHASLTLLFHRGALLDPHGGATHLLGQLLAKHLSFKTQVLWSADCSHDEFSLSTVRCEHCLFEVAEQIRDLFTGDLLSLAVFKQWEQMKRRHVLSQYESELDPQHHAYHTFLKAAFPNHPYERPMEGTAQSLTLLQKHHMAGLWQQFQQGEITFTLSGNIPVGSPLNELQQTLKSLPDFQPRSFLLPPIQSRRGVIHAKLPKDYVLMGRVLSVPTPETQLCLLQLERQLQSLFQSTPVTHEIRVFSEVWCILFWGYQTSLYMQHVLEPFASQLSLESAKVFEAYYLTGADWIQVSRAPERYYA